MPTVASVGLGFLMVEINIRQALERARIVLQAFAENIPLDFAPRLEKNANLTVFVTDPKGSQGILRPNHLHPPFNNKKARQALLLAVDQKNYLQAVIGNEKYYKTCPSVFMCGGLPYETSVGAPSVNLERAKQLLKESGYDGRPIVVLDPGHGQSAEAQPGRWRARHCQAGIAAVGPTVE